MQGLNHPTIVLLDSFDRLPLEEQKALLPHLHDVHVKSEDCNILKNLVFFIVGAIDLYELDPERTSPFHATNDIPLPDFTLEETTGFANRFLLEHQITLQNAAELYLYDMTAGHPYLLASLCQLIVSRMPSGGTPPFSIIQMAVTEIVRDRLFHQLRAKLIDMDVPTIDLLVRILKGTLVQMRFDSPLQKLIRLGIVSQGEYGFAKIRNPIFEYFLRTDSKIVKEVFKGEVAPMSQITLLTPSVNLRGFQLLSQIESTLRNFVACKLFAEYGENWPNKVLTPNLLKGLNKLRDKDGEQQSTLLCYTLLGELRAIIEAAWEIFETYFETKEKLSVFFHSLNLIRRKIAHNRNLSDVELSQFEAINHYFYEFMARRKAP